MFRRRPSGDIILKLNCCSDKFAKDPKKPSVMEVLSKVLGFQLVTLVQKRNQPREFCWEFPRNFQSNYSNEEYLIATF